MKAGVAEARPGFLGVLSTISRLLGQFLLPFGLFAVLAVGLHIGSDKVDDHLFVLISAADSLFDWASAAVVRTLGGLFGASEPWREAWSFRLAELIDLDTKA